MIETIQISQDDFNALPNAEKLICSELQDKDVTYTLLIGEKIKFGLPSHNFFDHYLLELESFDLIIVGTWYRVFGISISKGNLVFIENLSFSLVGLLKSKDGFMIIHELGIDLIAGNELCRYKTIHPGDARVIVDYELLDDKNLKLKFDNETSEVFQI